MGLENGCGVFSFKEEQEFQRDGVMQWISRSGASAPLPTLKPVKIIKEEIRVLDFLQLRVMC